MRECRYEERILLLMRKGATLDQEAAEHVASCSACRETAVAAAGLSLFLREESPTEPLPDPGLIYRRAAWEELMRARSRSRDRLVQRAVPALPAVAAGLWVAWDWKDFSEFLSTLGAISQSGIFPPLIFMILSALAALLANRLATSQE